MLLGEKHQCLRVKQNPYVVNTSAGRMQTFIYDVKEMSVINKLGSLVLFLLIFY